MLPVSSAMRVLSLYDTQKVYGERLKAYKFERPVVQIQHDAVTLSPEAVDSLSAHRKTKKRETPIAYGNPRVDNSA